MLIYVIPAILLAFFIVYGTNDHPLKRDQNFTNEKNISSVSYVLFHFIFIECTNQ